MKYPYLKLLSLSAFLFILISSSKKSSSSTSSVTAPGVTTTVNIIDVTSTAAQTGGSITSYGNDIETANGVCYSSTNQTPTLSDSKTSEPINSTGILYPVFVSNLANLTPNTVYYVRAYATNSAGTGYGSVIKFTTATNLSAVTATVTTFAGNGNT